MDPDETARVQRFMLVFTWCGSDNNGSIAVNVSRGFGNKRQPASGIAAFLMSVIRSMYSLDTVCDGHPDCPDHFDEYEELCNERDRQLIYKFVQRNRKWMQQKLFSGADLELVARSLAVGTSLQDISMRVGLTPKAERNLENVFIGVLQNDMRPLIRLGMPKGKWYGTSSLLTQIVDGGLNI